MGEPKGQCSHCGYKWYDHALDALPENERESAARIQAELDEIEITLEGPEPK
jgi:hypothetical protein